MHLTKGLQQKQENFSSRQRLVRINIFEPKSPLSNLTEVGWQGPALFSKAGWERGDTETGKHNRIISVFRRNQPGKKQTNKKKTIKPTTKNPHTNLKNQILLFQGIARTSSGSFLSISLFQNISFHQILFLLHLKMRLKFTLHKAKSQKNHTLNMMS